VEQAAAPEAGDPSATGRAPWWLAGLALLAAVALSADLLSGGALAHWDRVLSDLTGSWDLRQSAGYRLVWLVTQLGGRAFLLAVLAPLVGWLLVRRRTVLPLVRVLVALALLSLVVYACKYGAGRTAPSAGISRFRQGGTSFPSGHVANAVLMWGVAHWQAVDYGLPLPWQRLFRGLSVAAPVAAAAAMIALHFHWFSDALVGAAVGLGLLGVVHLLDGVVLSPWARARAGRPRR
jgi:membrane-associated phospholipid phosphatase